HGRQGNHVWVLALSCVATLGCAAVRGEQAAADLSGPVTGSLQGALLKLSLPTATLGEMRVEQDTITGYPWRACRLRYGAQGSADRLLGFTWGGEKRRQTPSTLRHRRTNRRSFLQTTGIAIATMILGVAPSDRPAYAAALTKAQRDKLAPDDIIALMKKGNERFRLGKESPHDYLAQQKVSAKGQYPAAVILSCIDSRAPAETIMDLGIGDCFNARVAGNIANDDILGSMEFACKVAGAKV